MPRVVFEITQNRQNIEGIEQVGGIIGRFIIAVAEQPRDVNRQVVERTGSNPRGEGECSVK